MKSLIASIGISIGLCVLMGCTESRPEAPTKPPKADVTILKWGPQGTRAGVGFAIQANQNSAIWFEQRGIHSAESVEVWFDTVKLSGMAIKPDVAGSAEVPPTLIAKPGQFPVYLMLKPQNQRVDLGSFVVSP